MQAAAFTRAHIERVVAADEHARDVQRVVEGDEQHEQADHPHLAELAPAPCADGGGVPAGRR